MIYIYIYIYISFVTASSKVSINKISTHLDHRDNVYQIQLKLLSLIRE